MAFPQGDKWESGYFVWARALNCESIIRLSGNSLLEQHNTNKP